MLPGLQADEGGGGGVGSAASLDYMDRALERFGFQGRLERDRPGPEYRLASVSHEHGDDTPGRSGETRSTVTFAHEEGEEGGEAASVLTCIGNPHPHTLRTSSAGAGRPTNLALEPGLLSDVGGRPILVTDGMCHLVSRLAQDLSLGRCACLVAGKGAGKSTVGRRRRA